MCPGPEAWLSRDKSLCDAAKARQSPRREEGRAGCRGRNCIQERSHVSPPQASTGRRPTSKHTCGPTVLKCQTPHPMRLNLNNRRKGSRGDLPTQGKPREGPRPATSHRRAALAPGTMGLAFSPRLCFVTLGAHSHEVHMSFYCNNRGCFRAVLNPVGPPGPCQALTLHVTGGETEA